MIDIKDFILTGKLGPIKIGDTPDFVRIKLGEPDLHEPAKKSFLEYFLYGSLELRFRREHLDYISLEINFNNDFFLISFVDCKVVFKKHINEISELLLSNKIDYRVDQIMTDESQTVLVTDKNVHLAFDSNGYLSKIASVRK